MLRLASLLQVGEVLLHQLLETISGQVLLALVAVRDELGERLLAVGGLLLDLLGLLRIGFGFVSLRLHFQNILVDQRVQFLRFRVDVRLQLVRLQVFEIQLLFSDLDLFV